jgi:hypothetical protein
MADAVIGVLTGVPSPDADWANAGTVPTNKAADKTVRKLARDGVNISM